MREFVLTKHSEVLLGCWLQEPTYVIKFKAVFKNHVKTGAIEINPVVNSTVTISLSSI